MSEIYSLYSLQSKTKNIFLCSGAEITVIVLCGTFVSSDINWGSAVGAAYIEL